MTDLTRLILSGTPPVQVGGQLKLSSENRRYIVTGITPDGCTIRLATRAERLRWSLQSIKRAVVNRVWTIWLWIEDHSPGRG